MTVQDWHEVIPLLARVYKRHAAGCCLHIVADDGNLENNHVAYCVDYAQQQGHTDCQEAADVLMRMSKTQRGQAYKHYKSYAGTLTQWFPGSPLP